jgi:ABC-2 type transport system permease protein
MIRALLYLRLTSLWNLVGYRIRRLRQPRYLVGAAVAVLYFYYFFLRRLGLAGPAALDAGAMASAGAMLVVPSCVLLSAIGLLRIAFAWISPADNPGFRFTEAEIAFLFAAPITRKTLIHFRLLSSQAAILFTSVLMAVVFNRFQTLGGNRLMRAIGLWVVFSIFSLHLNGTSLSLSRLKEKSAHYLLWRILAVAAILLYAIAVFASAFAWMEAHTSGGLFESRDWTLVLRDLLHSSPLRWLILPYRIAFGPYFATSGREFAVAMVPAVGLLALHYYWVLSSEARFEEGSIALAEKRAATKAAQLRGDAPKVGSAKPKAQPGPFPLCPTGPPEIAFLWKNLLSMRTSLLNRRTVVILIMLAVWMSFSLGPLLASHARSRDAGFYAPIIVMFCCIVGAYTLMVGPQIARQDLRNDLPNADILKTYPLEGWRLALGELLAPAAILTLVLWFLIIVCAFAFDFAGLVDWLTPAVRVTVALCMAAAAPVLCVLQLIVPNLIMVLMPGWYQASRSRGAGIEVTGQRLILGIGQLLFALTVGTPAVAAAALIIFSSHLFIGVVPAVVLASLVVLAILVGEIAVGLWLIGARFERLDLASEVR